MIAQFSRRGKRSEGDQELITELSPQVEVEHDQAVPSANNLANNRQVAKSQTVFRRQIVAIDDNLIIKSRQLTATVARREAEMAELHERHEAIYIRKEAVIVDSNEKIEIAQLLITRYKELDDNENSRHSRDHRRTDTVELRLRTIDTRWGSSRSHVHWEQ
jgi:hypothetical protein